MKTGCERRLDKSFRNAPVLNITSDSKIVLISDCHRGVGNSNDNFLKNQHIYYAALRYYYEKGFTYIEMGDGDELWENRSLLAIREIHGDIFLLLSMFKERNRLYMLYGNHDRVMKYNKEFPHYEGIILKAYNAENVHKKACCPKLYLTHGHQADVLNSVLWKLSRFLVRYLWKPLEQIGVSDPTSAARNYRHRQRSEKRLTAWAVKNNCCLITGHTHRPALDTGNMRYCNTGSCVHPYCITCIEIENGAASLIKWIVEVRQDRLLFVSREVIAGPEGII